MSGKRDKSNVNDLIAKGEADGDDSQGLIDKIHTAANAEAGASPEHEFGRPGPRFDHSSPFYVGLLGATGIAVVAAVCWIILSAGQVLLLLAFSVVIAVGLDPAVVWLTRHGMPRWLAVTTVLVLAVGVFGGFLALAIPVVANQATTLSNDLPSGASFKFVGLCRYPACGPEVLVDLFGEDGGWRWVLSSRSRCQRRTARSLSGSSVR